MDIIFEDKYILVVNKAPGVPSQPDFTGDESVLDRVCAHLDCFEEDVYVLHRLDRPVGGVMVFAKDKKSAAFLNKQIAENKIDKHYLAVVQGEALYEAKLTDYLVKNGRLNISKVVAPKENNAKLAKLEYIKLGQITESGCILGLLRVKLLTGRHHQIRVQLANAGYPIFGDGKYSKMRKAKPGETVALFAQEISFRHPQSKAVVKYEVGLPAVYPFNQFDLL